jgi:hypothetical protein
VAPEAEGDHLATVTFVMRDGNTDRDSDVLRQVEDVGTSASLLILRQKTVRIRIAPQERLRECRTSNSVVPPDGSGIALREFQDPLEDGLLNASATFGPRFPLACTIQLGR